MNIELLKAFHRQSRIETDCPPVYLPLSAVCDLATAADYMRKSWDTSATNEVDVDSAKQFVKQAFGKVLMYYRDIDLEEVSKAVPTWEDLAKKSGDPTKLVGDAFMDAIDTILTEGSGAYRATSIFGVICAVLKMNPEELVV